MKKLSKLAIRNMRDVPRGFNASRKVFRLRCYLLPL